jgi:hypothetical protein
LVAVEGLIAEIALQGIRVVLLAEEALLAAVLLVG